VSYEIDVEVKPAELVEETVDEQVKKFVVDYEVVAESAHQVATNAMQAFKVWYEGEARTAFGAVHATIEEHYVRRLNDLISGLEQDCRQHAASAEEKQQHLARLAEVEAEADRLLALLAEPIETLVRMPQ
jgi:hypothetical protein